MLVARQKRKENIAEYILYMWQVEDMLRGCGFDPLQIREKMADIHPQPPEVKDEIMKWYEQMSHLMVQENITDSGHCRFLILLVNDLNQLHEKLLLDPSEHTYQKIYLKAGPFIRELGEKSRNAYMNETDTCLHGLYGLLMLRLQKKPVGPETESAFREIGRMMAYLSARYRAKDEKKPDS